MTPVQKTPPPELTETERLMWMFDNDHDGMTDEESIALSTMIVHTLRQQKRGELQAIASKKPQDMTDDERDAMKTIAWLDRE